jgi:hypothetical protein
MATTFPIAIDDFTNPTDVPLGTPVGGRTHSQQHGDLNDAVEAIQTRVGVSGSAVPATIDFELHNTASGHDHDGINSKAVVIGPPTSGSSYVSGAFAFTPDTSVGTAVDQINQFLQAGISGGLLETDRKLILLADDGPFEGYPGAYRECLMFNNVFPSASIWYTDNTKTAKIVEQSLVYSQSNIVPDQNIYRVYNLDGVTVKTTVIDTIAYSGIFETSRTRVVI